MANKHVKNAQHHISLDTCRGKQQLDTTTEWPKSRPLTKSNIGKDVEQQELSISVGGKAKRYSHFGRQLTDFLEN